MSPTEKEKEKKASPPEKPVAGLEPGQILAAEFTYISQTAFQANEDRARATSYYLVSVGSFLAAILGTQFFAQPDPIVYLAFAGLFLFLALLAVLTILQLTRLRKAWRESALAMDQIKEYYIRYSGDPHLGEALRWQTQTLPPMAKRNSISFYLTLEVALIGGASAGTAAFFTLLGTGWLSWIITVGVGVLFFILELYIYERTLK
jgi:hypothetical protein